jgi:hypothetical protein
MLDKARTVAMSPSIFIIEDGDARQCSINCGLTSKSERNHSPDLKKESSREVITHHFPVVITGKTYVSGKREEV